MRFSGEEISGSPDMVKLITSVLTMIQLLLLFLGDDNLPVVCVIPSKVCHKGTDIDAVDAVILTDEKLRD